MRVGDPRPILALLVATVGHAADDAAEDHPALPEGQTLDEVLVRAAQGPSPSDVKTLHDDKFYAFWLFDQLEARAPPTGDVHLGWEDLGWVGGDLDRLWWKNEGEWLPADKLAGEMETDLLYGRLITPFWTVQAGAQYANEWSPESYEDTWAAALALQGLVPYKVELDASIYLSEELHLTSEVEAEYGLRITQRLLVQPRVDLGLSAQDIPGRNIGWGLTSADLDLRVRYEIRRELAPYLGVRGAFDIGRTAMMVKDDGGAPSRGLLLGGVRLAF